MLTSSVWAFFFFFVVDQNRARFEPAKKRSNVWDIGFGDTQSQAAQLEHRASSSDVVVVDAKTRNGRKIVEVAYFGERDQLSSF
jgi:hypothetical protein